MRCDAGGLRSLRPRFTCMEDMGHRMTSTRCYDTVLTVLLSERREGSLSIRAFTASCVFL